MCRAYVYTHAEPEAHTNWPAARPSPSTSTQQYVQVAATQAYLSALNRVAVSRGSLPVHPQFGKI